MVLLLLLLPSPLLYIRCLKHYNAGGKWKPSTMTSFLNLIYRILPIIWAWVTSRALQGMMMKWGGKCLKSFSEWQLLPQHDHECVIHCRVSHENHRKSAHHRTTTEENYLSCTVRQRNLRQPDYLLVPALSPILRIKRVQLWFRQLYRVAH